MARTIGNLADETGVDVETIRYYQRIDLIDKPPKPTSGWRTYPDEAVRRIRFIKRAQQLGFSLDEIDELLAMDARSEESDVCGKTQELVAQKLREVRSKIRDLEQIESSLSRLSNECPGEGTAGDCPILEDFRFTMPENQQNAAE